MAPFTRKGRNPGPVDGWLDTLGYYRKNVAYDETCLFRSISEQLYASQLFHEKIRKDCITYGKTHHSEFVKFFPAREDWEVRLNHLEKHMVICGRPEIHLISKTFQTGIVIFDGINLQIDDLTENEYDESLFICHLGGDHYDAVYYKSYIQNAGFCQSIVYNVLYENVFHIPKVPEIVETMLYHKPMLTFNGEGDTEDSNGNKEKSVVKRENFKQTENIVRYDSTLEFKKHLHLDNKDEHLNDYEYMLKTNLAPFPFKVAKALDPTIYRNIEYDTWTEMRKEMRLGDWYYGDNNLIEGSGCILKEHGVENHCYIQEILKKENTAIVFLTKVGEKKRVRLSDLRPEHDAKPWPLPYRFSKNLVISIPKLELPEKKGFRKRREKKRTISKCSSTSEVAITESNLEQSTTNVNVHSFEGAPLQQQIQSPQILTHTPKSEINEVETISTQEAEDIPPVCTQLTYDNVWQRQESVIWPPTPPITYNTYNTVVPSSPEVVYQQDQQTATFYSNEYQPYNIWPNGEYLAPLPPQNQMTPSPQSEIPVTPDGFSYVFSDGSNYSPNYYPNNRQYQPALTSPQIEVYPQTIYQPAISTPVILTPATNEMLPPPSPISQIPHVAMYSPAIEVPCSYYPPPSPFMFPPTPTQPTWYQAPSVNSQGFIFPAINVTPTSPTPLAQ